jgi:hypothetical protein
MNSYNLLEFICKMANPVFNKQLSVVWKKLLPSEPLPDVTKMTVGEIWDAMMFIHSAHIDPVKAMWTAADDTLEEKDLMTPPSKYLISVIRYKNAAGKVALYHVLTKRYRWFTGPLSEMSDDLSVDEIVALDTITKNM